MSSVSTLLERRLSVGICALVTATGVAACSSGGNAADDPAAAPVIAFSQAADPAHACMQLTSGFKRFFTAIRNNPDACITQLPFAINADVKVTGIKNSGDQKIVVTQQGPWRRSYYVARENGAWKINSIGEKHPSS